MRDRTGGFRNRLITLVLGLVLLPVGLPAVEAPPAHFGDGLCALAEGPCVRPLLAVFSAFPGELEPLVARASVRETLVIGDRVLRVGTIGGVPVVLGLLGIGYENAAATTRLVLDHFEVAGFVVSGVAGSPRRIGDVTVPLTWAGPDGVPYSADAALLDIAREVAGAGVPLERCTSVPPEPPGPTVCLDFQPGIFVGGAGETDDPYGDNRLRCNPTENDVYRDVFACDVNPATVGGGVSAGAGTDHAVPPGARVDLGVPTGASVVFDATDMETAAVAREAAGRGVPFVAFRAVSDGAGDPLGLPGFPTQFFAYYRLAARNAAAATTALIERRGARTKLRRVRARNSPIVRASCGWERWATPMCAGRHAPAALRASVTRVCRALVRDPADATAVTRGWERAAALAAKPGARRRLGRTCDAELVGTLQERAGS